jgi:hypothetical protein
MRRVLAAVALALALAPAAGIAAQPAPGAFDRLACLAPDVIAAVRGDVHQAKAAYAACRDELHRKLGAMQLTPAQEQVAFAAVLAQGMAPYGSSRSVRLEDLLRDKAMDCDNYAILTGYLAREFGVATLSFAGFDGGAVGNHAQLFYAQPHEELLLDPTIGMVARVDFNHLLQGKPVAAADLKVFRQHDDPAIDAFARTVSGAVRDGKYLPSDLLYYFHSLHDYIAFSDDIVPLWSRPTYDPLLLRFPTPASAALRRNLEAAKAAQRAKTR